MVKRDTWHLIHDHELFYVYYRINDMEFGQHIYGARRFVRFLRDEFRPSYQLISIRSLYRSDRDA